jgi:hypothetical protein
MWANKTPEERAAIGSKISKSLTGKKQSEAHRLANSEGHKGVKQSAEAVAKRSESLKRCYAEGRRQPVRSSHRKGVKLSPEHRAKFDRTGKKPWNAGKKTGPRPKEVTERIAAKLKGRKRQVTPAMKEGAIRAAKKKLGKKHTPEQRARRSASMVEDYLNGRRNVSPKAGYGKGRWYQTAHLGVIWLRSSSEEQRARELDAANTVWFFEVERFPVIVAGVQKSYMPDFWVVPNCTWDDVPPEAIANPNPFLATREVHLEDVKGWWHEGHKTWAKIRAFQEQYCDLRFEIVVRGGMPTAKKEAAQVPLIQPQPIEVQPTGEK